MGNSESNTPYIKNKNMPNRQIINRQPAFGSANAYNYYPAPYMPQQYAYQRYPANYPGYPVNYPVVYDEAYRQNEFYPQPQAKNNVPEQRNPTYHHNHAHHSHRHPHHHQSTPSSKKEYLNSPVLQERATSPISSASIVNAQKPASSIVTHKLASPVANKEVISPRSLVHHSSSEITKKSSTPVLIEKPSSSFIVQQHQSPSPLVASNSFEKAPKIETNYVAKSSDSHSIHSYGPGKMSIIQRRSSRSMTSGNRWYDHDYDKRVKSLTVTDV